MESFKEFQGKDLDAAIGEACSYFNTEREKLEIEILQDAKSGIFGIVGARKAKVRARRARLRQTVESILNRRNDTRQEEAAPPSPASSSSLAAPAVGGRKEAEGAAVDTASVSAPDAPVAREAQPTPRKAPARDKSEPHAAPQSASQVAPQAVSSATNAGRNSGMNSGTNSGTSSGAGGQGCEQPALADDLDEAAEGLQPTPVEELDAQRLQSLTEEVVRQLVRPVVGEDVQLEVSVGNGRVQVQVDCGEDSGLLIGREGQTLASLRYLASRLVSRGMNAAVRIQLDVGEYRRRQDEKLREMALALAEKVRQSGRSYSTRPLSSYHRRIVHVCLQDVQDVQTRSTGDGPLKRVVIMRRKSERA